MKLPLLIIIAAGIFFAPPISRAENVRVGLYVSGSDPRIVSRIEEYFRTELGRIPDVVVIGDIGTHRDIDIEVTEVFRSGIVAHMVIVLNNDEVLMALRDAGTEVPKIKAELKARNINDLYSMGYNSVSTGSIYELRELVSTEVNEINKHDFQSVRSALQKYGRGDQPSSALSSTTDQ